MKSRSKNTRNREAYPFTNNRWTPVVLAGLLSALLCVYLYGISILLPTNTAWLYGNGDISQHQIGWDFYRNDTWRFPLGSMNNLAYPEGTSLVYMDSIPLAAIIFKLINPLLPEDFQYFGLWGLACFVLNAGITAVILRRFSTNTFRIIVGSLIVCLLPIFLMRTYAHTALSSQWLILIGISFIVYADKLRDVKKSILMWSALMAVSVAIHPYFVPMNAIILLVYLILQSRSWMSVIGHMGTSLVASFVSFWLVGGFVTKDVGTATLGMFGADVNALMNPITFSYFLKPFPTTVGAYEGLGYLGLGVYLAAFLLVARVLVSWRHKSFTRSHIRNSMIHNKRLIAAGIVMMGSILLAIGPVVYLNGNQLGVIPLPDTVAQILSIFRSTGRFIWIAGYSITLFVIILIIRSTSDRQWSQRGSNVLLILLLCVQFVDVTKSPGMELKTSSVRTASLRYVNRFETAEVHQLMLGKKHVVYTANSLHADNFFELGVVVASAKLTINDGYISREPVAVVERNTKQAREELVSGSLRSDTVYVTNVPSELASVHNLSSVSIIQAGDTWLAAQKSSF